MVLDLGWENFLRVNLTVASATLRRSPIAFVLDQARSRKGGKKVLGKERGQSVLHARVSGLGAYRPGQVVRNETVSCLTDVDAEWVLARTGIRERRFTDENETVASMAVIAGRRALAAAGTPAAELSLVLVCSSTNHRSMPGAAPQVAYELGAHDSGAYDLNAVCAGFTYGVAQASSAVREGAGPVLVVGSEKLSAWLDPTDAGTYPIFGDGAGAVVVSSADEPGISPTVWGHDGARSELIRVDEKSRTIEMKGPLVYKWATSALPKIVHRICAAAGTALPEVDWLVLHQANLRIIDVVATALEFPADRVARDVERSGNTSAASIPLALDTVISTGGARAGQTALLLGFGSGLTYSGQIIRLP